MTFIKTCDPDTQLMLLSIKYYNAGLFQQNIFYLYVLASIFYLVFFHLITAIAVILVSLRQPIALIAGL